MSHNDKIGCLLLVTLFLFNQLHGQGAVFQHYTTDDGLPDNTVTCIRQSPDGFLWVGTTNGLSRFDGKHFKRYNAGKGNRKLSFSHIQDLEIDEDGGIWIATRRGLNRLDPTVDTFLRISQEKYRDMPSEIGHDVTIDHEGRVWYASDNRNPACWLPQKQSFSIFPWREWVIAQEISSKVYLNINRIVPKRGNALWLCTNVGLFSLQLTDTTFTHYPPPAGFPYEFTDGFDDQQGRLWLNTGGGGIEVFNYRDNTWEWPTEHLGFEPHTNLFTQWNILPVDESRIMAGLTGGLAILDAKWFGGKPNHFSQYMLWKTDDRQLRLEVHQPGRVSSLPAGEVISLFKDREHILWIGTTGGLAKLDPAYQQFPILEPPAEVEDRQISYIWESPGGEVRYLSCAGTAPLFRLDLASGKIHTLRLPNGEDFFYLHKMIADNCGNLWLMELNRISKLNLTTNEIEVVELPETKNGMNRQIDFNDGVYDGEAAIYFGTDKAGLLRLDLNRLSFDPIRVQDKKAETQIMALHWDERAKSLWFASRNGWLGRYDPQEKQIDRFRHEDGNPRTLASEMVVGTTQLPDGTMCFITEPEGLSLLPPGATDFQNFSMETGLPVNLFTRIQSDDQGRLWLLYKNGMCSFDPGTGTIREYGREYGLEFSTGVIRFSRTPGGHMLLGVRGGYMRFHPDSLYVNAFPPRPVLTTVKIHDEEYLPTLQENDFVLNTPHYLNSITLGFAMLNFTDSDNNWTHYRLQGIDPEWVKGSGAETIRYFNLPPGHYRFELAAYNSNGAMTPLSPPLRIRISPHFTQTLWFRLSLGILFLAGVYGIYRVRITQLLKIQAIRNKIAADLHDDVAATISSIILYSEHAGTQADKASYVRTILDKISANARDSLEIMREIVWAIQPDKDGVHDLRAHMLAYARPLCKAKHIRLLWEEQLPKNWKLSLPERRNIYLIFKEAINNALLHSACSEIRVSLIHQGKQFCMCIADNGRGMDITTPVAGNGRKNMQLRATEIGGQLDIDTQPAAGTRIVLQVKLRK